MDDAEGHKIMDDATTRDVVWVVLMVFGVIVAYCRGSIDGYRERRDEEFNKLVDNRWGVD